MASQSEASDTDTVLLEADTRKIKHKIRLVIGTKDEITITPKKIIKRLNCLMRVCTEGGTNVDGVPITYRDDEDPFCIFTIEAFLGEKDLTTSFLIRKEDIYVVAYIFGDKFEEDRWILTKNSNIKMIYPPNPTTSSFELNYNSSALGDTVGPWILLEALNMPLFGLGEGFQSIYYHIAEGVRFTKIQALVVTSMKKREFEYLQLAPDLRGLMNSWKDLSTKLFAGNSAVKKQLSCGRIEHPMLKVGRKLIALEKHDKMIRSIIKRYRRDAPKIDGKMNRIKCSRTPQYLPMCSYTPEFSEIAYPLTEK
ncbi:hypothetical protein OROHE_013349 [Orobanche hederae]